MARPCSHTPRLLIALVLSLALGFGCAPWMGPAANYNYFAAPDPADPWSPKISGWQRRELADPGDLALEVPAVAEGARTIEPDQDTPEGRIALRSKYFNFRAEQRRAVARDFAEWIQSQSKKHYIADGPVDHWATLEETLRGNGDDCDGLELLVYHALRDLGFGETEVYRSIVFRPSDGQHHMVTLWFEEATDPWVIDPTGAMSPGMQRMSDIPAWKPLKVFSGDAEYTVQTRPRDSVPAKLAPR